MSEQFIRDESGAVIVKPDSSTLNAKAAQKYKKQEELKSKLLEKQIETLFDEINKLKTRLDNIENVGSSSSNI